MAHQRTLLLLMPVLLTLGNPTHAADVTVTLPAGDAFVIENNSGAIERLRVDEANGNISRNGALFVHTTGTLSTFVGVGAGHPLGSGNDNSAFGWSALSSLSTGTDNSAFGNEALLSNTTGDGNSAFGWNALYGNTTGINNSAFGKTALLSNISGVNNSAFGRGALVANTTGNHSSAFGANALQQNNGADNSAFGSYALVANTGGFDNSAFGYGALRSNTTGGFNSAFGKNALGSATTATHNVAIGTDAGVNQTIGKFNIYIQNSGVAGEDGRIKIGNSLHTETFIEGIDGNTATGGVAVLVNSSNELHTLVSSRRFKEAVRDMGQSSKRLMELRPVTFRYKEETGGDGQDEYGLIAEEVAAVAPELVTYDGDGEPYSVRYHVFPSMLLNEVQEQQRTIRSQAVVIADQQRRIAALADRLGRVERITAESAETDR